MCGFTITKKPIPNFLQHRGVHEAKEEFSNWYVNFNSLPLSSHGTGIDLPLDLGGAMLVFNGEIFNYKDLDPAAVSDVHYLRNALKGSSVLDLYKESLKWDGFWSIAVIIKGSEEVYCFTDPLGKKQLYWSKDGFASEIKPLLREYTYQPYSDSQFFKHHTNFDSVKRIPPGILCGWTTETGCPKVIRSLDYFQDMSMKSISALIRNSVLDRVENRYDGISILLSGGLDSNIVLHHLLEYTRNVEVVSMDNQERELIERACDFHGVTPKWVSDEYTEKDLTEAVTHYEHSLDYGSLIPNYLLFRACSNSLVFTGDGADELFGGYTRAKKSDTWKYDVMGELPYYHNIRIDRTSMAYTKEARSPLMSYPLLSFSASLPRPMRTGKRILRDTYRGILPDFIVDGEKTPLRHSGDKEKNRILIKRKHEQLFNYENF